MNTAEMNKLIAEFMKFKSTNNCIRDESGKYYDYHANKRFSCIKEQEVQIESENGWGLVEQDFLFIEDLKFHSDWNWLIEVCKEITTAKEWEDYPNQTQFYDIFCQMDSEDICLEVVKFIQWSKK